MFDAHSSHLRQQTDHRVTQTISILPPCSILGMWGSKKASCDGLAKKKMFHSIEGRWIDFDDQIK